MGVSRFHDDNDQLGNLLCSPVSNLSVRLHSNATLRRQIRPSCPFFLVAPPTHFSNSDF